MSEITVRRLGAADAEVWKAARERQVRDHPTAFYSTIETDRIHWPVERVRERLDSDDGTAIFGAWDGDALVGTCGVGHDHANHKVRHRAEIWGVWVAPEARGQRLGERLLHAALAHIRTALPSVDRVVLSVSTNNPTARQVYEAVGFEVWGTEEAFLRVDGEDVAEDHMVLRLA